MIKLRLGPKPNFLVRHGDNLIEKIMSSIYNGTILRSSVKKAYKNPEIKASVLVESHEKCAYCETKVTHQYPGDIEHIIPKKKFPRLTLTWSNLTFSCFKCNNSKRDYFGKHEEKLLNPFKDNINEHLIFIGPIIFNFGHSARGEITIKKLKLNRPRLIERRTEKIFEIENIMNRIGSETNDALINLLKEEIEDYSLPEREYSFCSYCFIESRKL